MALAPLGWRPAPGSGLATEERRYRVWSIMKAPDGKSPIEDILASQPLGSEVPSQHLRGFAPCRKRDDHQVPRGRPREGSHRSLESLVPPTYKTLRRKRLHWTQPCGGSGYYSGSTA